MLHEYWDRTAFVMLHGALLFIYFISLAESWLLLHRERRALRWATKRGTNNSRITPNFSDPKIRDSALGKSTLIASLHRTTSASAGETFNLSDSVDRAISTWDDVTRFCINGFVVVGLMGTLAAFYEMWRHYNSSSGNSASTVPNTTYLEGMATALVVSFMGLILALGANLLFSLLKASRQLFIVSLSRFSALVGVSEAANPMQIFLDRITSSLEGPAQRLVDQNAESLNRLIVVMDARTKQLNDLVSETLSGWQSVMQDFTRETLKAVSDLKDSSDRLDKSSREVAATMTEVSKGLERTKDITKIINRLDSTAESLVGRISERLEKATDTWASNIAEAVSEQAKANEMQTTAIQTAMRDLSTTSASNFDSAVVEMKESLASLRDDFTEKTDSIAAHWMTKMSSETTEVTRAMELVINGWQESILSTSANISTTLVSSREHIAEITEKVSSLNNGIETLQSLLIELTERTGSPVHMRSAVEKLAKTVEELTTLRELVEGLVSRINENQDLREFKSIVEANSAALIRLPGALTGLSSAGDKEIIKAIDDVRDILPVLVRNVESQLHVRNNGRGEELVPALEGINASLLALQEDLVGGRITVRVRQKPRPGVVSGLKPKKASWVRRLSNRLLLRKPQKEDDLGFYNEEE